MKIIDKIVGYVGTDRMLHFLVGALITAQFEATVVDQLTWWLMAVPLVLVAVLAILKELLFDDTFDFKDVFFSLLGAFLELWSLIIRMWFTCDIPFGGLD